MTANDDFEEVRWTGGTYKQQPSLTDWRPSKPEIRNEHQLADGNWYAEMREPDETLKIDDLNAPVLGRLIFGRTITGLQRDPDNGAEWPQGANDVRVTLDDGSELIFSSWGYDAWGCVTEYTLPE